MFAFILQFKAYSLFLDMKTTSIAEGYRKYRVIETHRLDTLSRVLSCSRCSSDEKRQ